jgi:methylated-DNA-protein-cysteine methyltransferase related protein
VPEEPSYHARVYRVVRQIPRGRVATYGQIAVLVPGCTPRMVGYAMAAVPDGSGVPWHRVLNARGEVSGRASGDGAARQRRLLRAEGVRFDRRQRVDLDEVGWLPRE